jgi:hypothetical protein
MFGRPHKNLQAPPPTIRISFRLTISPGPRLRYSTGDEIVLQEGAHGAEGDGTEKE